MQSLSPLIVPLDHLEFVVLPEPAIDGFSATLPEIPATGAGPTIEAALADLQQELLDYVDALGLDDAVGQLLSDSPLAAEGLTDFLKRQDFAVEQVIEGP